MFSTSLKTQLETLRCRRVWIPAKTHWKNYPEAFNTAPFARYFLNSLYFAPMVVVAEVISNSFIAFGFARLRAHRP